jgi:hypothetical protein
VLTWPSLGLAAQAHDTMTDELSSDVDDAPSVCQFPGSPVRHD